MLHSSQRSFINCIKCVLGKVLKIKPAAFPIFSLKADKLEQLLVGFQKLFDFLPTVLEITHMFRIKK